MTDQALYQWPPPAEFGRAVPKSKFYEHGSVSSSIRERFVAEVQRITWAYKLADSTIHLRGNSSVPEIQVFAIDAKGEDVDDRVLQAIDKAVHFPIVYELIRGQGAGASIRMCAAHKTRFGRQPVLSAYFTTEWLPAHAARMPLPRALDLPALHEALLASLLPVAVRPGEDLAGAVTRLADSRKLEREIATLERRLRTEPQLNRKIELRRHLRAKTEALTALTDPEHHASHDGPGQEEPQWTS